MSLPQLGARAVLVTNAPDIRLGAALAQLGLAGAFDDVFAAAGKPEGLADLARPWCADGPVLSVGDIWRNDLAPVHALGATTALVGSPRPGEEPTMHAPTLAELLPRLAAWTADAAAQRTLNA